MSQAGHIMEHDINSKSSRLTTRAGITLEQAEAVDAATTGNKAARLAELRGRGFNVPRLRLLKEYPIHLKH